MNSAMTSSNYIFLLSYPNCCVSYFDLFNGTSMIRLGDFMSITQCSGEMPTPINSISCFIDASGLPIVVVV